MLVVNNACTLDVRQEEERLFRENEIEALDQGQNSWHLTAQSVGLTVFNKSETWKQEITMKRIMVNKCLCGDLKVLNMPCGVVLSLCTGFAKRVPLRIVVAETMREEDILHAFTRPESQTPLPVQQWENILGILYRRLSGFDALNYEHGNDIFTEYLEHVTDQIYWPYLRWVLSSQLSRLQRTGFNEQDKKFRVAFAERQNAAKCLVFDTSKPKFRWLQLMRDTIDSATFAVITKECLIIHPEVSAGLGPVMYCQSPIRDENRSKLFSFRLLQTNVRACKSGGEGQNLINGRLYNFKLDKGKTISGKISFIASNNNMPKMVFLDFKAGLANSFLHRFGLYEYLKEIVSPSIPSHEIVICAFDNWKREVQDTLHVSGPASLTTHNPRISSPDNTTLVPENENVALSFPLHTAPLNPRGPATDSGYASMAPPKSDVIYQQESSDTASIYTDNEVVMLPSETKDQLISALAIEILSSLESDLQHHRDNIERTFHVLPRILKELASEMKQEAKPGLNRVAAIFVRHHRQNIAREFRDQAESWLSQADGFDYAEEERVVTDIDMSVQEKFNRWQTEDPEYPLQHSEQQQEELEEHLEESDEDSEPHVPYLSEGRYCITESRAYATMLEKIRAVLRVTTKAGTRSEVIRLTVLDALSSIPASRVISGESFYTCEFDISWNPRSFLKQQYQEPEQVSLGDVITLTGSAVDAQAATCAEYLRQTWPQIGEETLRALEVAIDSFETYSCELSNGTSLSFSFRDDWLFLNACGLDQALADIGEIFAWLGAACRSSTDDETIAFTCPEITAGRSSPPSFTIAYTTELLAAKEHGLSGEGNCWYAMFRNPVIVSGFPILLRTQGQLGLQVPWNLMVGLGRVDQAVSFNDRFVLKGFSTMFVPTKRVKDSVQWHFVYNEDSSRLSYLHIEKSCPQSVKMLNSEANNLAAYTNFVGWASSISIEAGAKSIKYDDIEYPSLNYSSAGCAFEKFSISAGKIVNVGGTFCRGIKDTPKYISVPKTYLEEIDDASKWHVVLYDSGDRRAWMLDGATALLHIVCARLHSTLVKRSTHFKLAEFTHFTPDGDLDAAQATLTSEKNRSLPIFEEKQTEQVIVGGNPGKSETKTTIRMWCVEDLVRQTWHILEQIQDHQTSLLSAPQIGIHGTPREKLEGWGFKDIVERDNPLHPRVAILKSSGRGWVDFTRSRQVGAITLLGEGFGELIKPRQPKDLCKIWKSVPTGRDYLVVTVKSLEKICSKRGKKRSNPLEVVQGIHWSKGIKLFEPCSGCRTNRFGSSCDRVQTLLPLQFGHKKNPNPFEHLDGAVIFGKSRMSRWLYPSQGNPYEGEEEEPDAEDHEDIHDSGIGTSIDTSSNAESASSGVKPQPLGHPYLEEDNAGADHAASDGEMYTAPTTPIESTSSQLVSESRGQP